MKKLSPERAVSKMKLNRKLISTLNAIESCPPIPKPKDWECIKELVAAGANANVKSSLKIGLDDNETRWAAHQTGQMHAPSASDFVGSRTALMIAAFYGHTDICAFLLANGANLDARNTLNNQTALDYAKSGIEDRYSENRRKTAKFLMSVNLLLQLVDKEILFKAFIPSFSECVDL